MEKIVNYIKNGKGNGLLFLLATSVLVTIFMLIMVKQIYGIVEPQILATAEEVLPITVKDGKIIDPIGVYKKTAIQIGAENSPDSLFPVVLDTRDEVSQVPSEKIGVFIMRDMIYMVTPGKIERMSMSDGVIDITMTKDILRKFATAMSVVFTFIYIAVFFLILLCKALLTAGIGTLSLKAMKKPGLYSFSSLMRMASLAIFAVEVVVFPLVLWGGVPLNSFRRLLIEIVIVLIYLSNEAKKQ